MPASTDTRPPGVNHAFRPGNAAELTIVFPSGSLTGRTFSSSLNGTALSGGNGSVTVLGDTMTVVASVTLTTTLGTGSFPWLLTETTGGGSEKLFIGTWTGSNRPNVTGVQTIDVLDGDVTVNITGGPQAFSPDLAMQATTISGGVAIGGVIRRTQSIQIPWSYTLDTAPTDSALGTAIHIPITVTVDNTGGGLGPQFQTGHYGPRAIVNVEGIARYAQNMTAFGFAPVGIGDFLTLANNAGVARTLVPAWSHLSGRSVIADGAVCTLAPNDTAQGGAAFSDAPVYASLNTGQLEGLTNNHEIISFHSTGAIFGNVDIRKRVAFDAERLTTTLPWAPSVPHWDIPGSVWDSNGITLDEEIGLRVQQFTTGALKLGISTAHPIRLMDTDLTLSGTNTLIDVANARTFTMTSNGAMIGLNFGSTLIYEDDAGAFGVGNLFNVQPIYKNATGEAHSLGSIIGMFGINMAPTFRADNAAVSMASLIPFRAASVIDRLSAGVFTLTTLTDFQSTPTVNTGNTITTRKGVEIADVAGAGTVTTNIALDVAAQAKGGTNIGIRNAASYVATPLAQTLSAAGNTITANAEVKALTNSTGGSLTLTSAPTIADGQTGQEIELLNVGAQDIVIQDQGTLASSNLRLTAATLTLQPRDSVRLRYNSTIGDWVQCGPLVNVL